LYAAGEVACTGLHGANRLASNSLLEGLVFGARAAEAMQQPPVAAPLKNDRVMADGSSLFAMADGSVQPSGIDVIQDLMWRKAGLFRTREGLAEAVGILRGMTVAAPPTTIDEWRLHNLVTVARLIAVAALRREESRGGHFRQDFPHRDDQRWRIHLVDQQDTK
jgi:L-aspartate oxidase